jgi:heat-inducible transcriptional repressor
LLYSVIRDHDKDGITVKIGTEIGVDEFKECSVVSSTYNFNEDNIGRIGVLGPTRMEYGAIISVVDYIRKTLSDIFSGIYL